MALYHIFSRGHATLELAVSVGRSIGRSRRVTFLFSAPDNLSATARECIRPCFLYISTNLNGERSQTKKVLAHENLLYSSELKYNFFCFTLNTTSAKCVD